jgi:hypothetical protein
LFLQHNLQGIELLSPRGLGGQVEQGMPACHSSISLILPICFFSITCRIQSFYCAKRHERAGPILKFFLPFNIYYSIFIIQHSISPLYALCAMFTPLNV